jgi:hypothetical protein
MLESEIPGGRNSPVVPSKAILAQPVNIHGRETILDE